MPGLYLGCGAVHMCHLLSLWDFGGTGQSFPVDDLGYSLALEAWVMQCPCSECSKALHCTLCIEIGCLHPLTQLVLSWFSRG